MAPYSKKVVVRYDGKNLVLDRQLDLPLNQDIEVTIEVGGPSPSLQIDPRSVEERVAAFKAITGFDNGIVLSNEAFRRDENMYPDRF